MNLILKIIFDYLAVGVVAIVLFLIIVSVYCRLYLMKEPYKLLKFGYKCSTFGNKDGKVNQITLMQWIVTFTLWPIVLICSAIILDKVISEL